MRSAPLCGSVTRPPPPPPPSRPQNIAHELGHNLFMAHAGAYSTALPGWFDE